MRVCSTDLWRIHDNFFRAISNPRSSTWDGFILGSVLDVFYIFALSVNLSMFLRRVLKSQELDFNIFTKSWQTLTDGLKGSFFTIKF